jgi:ribonuclease HIII
MQTPSFFVVQIDLTLAQKIQADLAAQGFSFTKPPYTVFSAKKIGISCTLYESGKLTVQGKEMGPFIEFYLEPEILGSLKFTHPELDLNLSPHIGMDEAGKGDFFGPLCVAAVFADSEMISRLHQIGVRDSKTLGDVKIAKLSTEIRAMCPHAAIRLFPAKYNELFSKFKNLNRLLAWAHATALEELVGKTGCKEAILDRFAEEYVVDNFLKQKKLDVHLIQRTKGEQDTVVAAASILARASFVDGIAMLGREWNFEFPKGASSIVIRAGKEFVVRYGQEALARVSKTHFKTTHDLKATD